MREIKVFAVLMVAVFVLGQSVCFGGPGFKPQPIPVTSDTSDMTQEPSSDQPTGSTTIVSSTEFDTVVLPKDITPSVVEALESLGLNVVRSFLSWPKDMGMSVIDDDGKYFLAIPDPRAFKEYEREHDIPPYWTTLFSYEDAAKELDIPTLKNQPIF